MSAPEDCRGYCDWPISRCWCPPLCLVCGKEVNRLAAPLAYYHRDRDGWTHARCNDPRPEEPQKETPLDTKPEKTEREKALEAAIDNALLRLEGDPMAEACPRCGALALAREPAHHEDDCPWSVATATKILREALEGRAA